METPRPCLEEGRALSHIEDCALLAVIVGPDAWDGPRAAAWGTLWERHSKVVHDAAVRQARALWVGDGGMQAELAEEAVGKVGETFTQLAKDRKIPMVTTSFAAYLAGSAGNACKDLFRSAKVRGRGLEPIENAAGPSAELADPRGGCVEPHRATHGLLEHLEARSEARRLLERLAAEPNGGWKQATVLRLFHGEEWSVREIAAYFHVTERTVFRWKGEGETKFQKYEDQGEIHETRCIGIEGDVVGAAGARG